MALTNRQRLRKVEEAIRNGEVPVIKTPLPGVVTLLEAYGLTDKDVFIPDPNKSPKENREARNRWKGRKQYKKRREQVGMYTDRGEVNRDITDKERTALRNKLARKLEMDRRKV